MWLFNSHRKLSKINIRSVRKLLRITHLPSRKSYLFIICPIPHGTLTKSEIRWPLCAPLRVYLLLFCPQYTILVQISPCLSIIFQYLTLFTYIYPHLALFAPIWLYLPLFTLNSPFSHHCVSSLTRPEQSKVWWSLESGILKWNKYNNH